MYELLNLGFFVFIANPLLYTFFYYLLINYNQQFQKLSHERIRYVIKNLSKSVFLCFLSLYALPDIIDLYSTGVWNNELLHLLGSIYCATDIAGLLFVPNLPTTTKFHHSVVTVLSVLNLLVDYQQPGIHRAMVLLCYFSMVPYLVNTLLGLRPLGFPILKIQLARICSFIYGLSILMNFSYQHYYVVLANDYIIFRGLYLILYWIILYDDLWLLNYLTFTGFDLKFWPYLELIINKVKNSIHFVSCVFERPRLFPNLSDDEDKEEIFVDSN